MTSRFSTVAPKQATLFYHWNCWQDVHPGLVTIPVDWEYQIPYGLLYSPGAPEDVLRFVEAVKTLQR